MLACLGSVSSNQHRNGMMALFYGSTRVRVDLYFNFFLMYVSQTNKFNKRIRHFKFIRPCITLPPHPRITIPFPPSTFLPSFHLFHFRAPTLLIFPSSLPYIYFLMQSKSTILLHPQQLLSSIITCLTQLISQSQMPDHSTSIFNLKAAPTISIADYLSRMFKYMNSSISIFVYALVLIDRVQEYNPLFILHKKNVHRIMLAANVVSAKYLDDFYYKNSFYASVGGVNVKVLNQLELEFLTLIQFNAQVREDMFLAYLERLETFTEVNRQGDEKENCRGMKSMLEKNSQLKKKDSNVDNGTAKVTAGVKNERSRQKSDEMVKPQTQQ